MVYLKVAATFVIAIFVSLIGMVVGDYIDSNFLRKSALVAAIVEFIAFVASMIFFIWTC